MFKNKFHIKKFMSFLKSSMLITWQSEAKTLCLNFTFLGKEIRHFYKYL